MVDDIKGCGLKFNGTTERIYWKDNTGKWRNSLPTLALRKWNLDGADSCGSYINKWLCVQCAQKYGIQW